jgi:hypothetical protein
LQLFNRRLHALKYAVQRRIVDDERVRCCCSSLIKQSDRTTQQRERLRVLDDAHSMKILLYLRLQFSLRVLASQRDRGDDDDDVHFNFFLIDDEYLLKLSF